MATTKLTQTGTQVQADLNLTENLQDAFSTSSTYAVGAYVIYNSKLWRCHTAVSSAGAWTGTTNWTEVKLDDLTDDCLKLSGGTMTGNIKLNNQNAKIIDSGNKNVINANNSSLNIGDTTTDAAIYTGNWSVRHCINNSSYNMLDTYNTYAITTSPTGNSSKGIRINGSDYYYNALTLTPMTTAPSSANTDGLKIVVLTSEPATYYNGYYYIIAPTT